MTLALRLYDVVLALHITAVVVAFGLPLSYPVMVPLFRRMHPRAMPALHSVQDKLGERVIAPGLGLIVLLGVYLATDAKVWDELWVQVPLVLSIVIGVLGGAVVGRTHKPLGELAAADVAAAGQDGPVTWSAEYESMYTRSMRLEYVVSSLVLVAIFFMAAKPGA
jgi:hypothetical protein